MLFSIQLAICLLWCIGCSRLFSINYCVSAHSVLCLLTSRNRAIDSSCNLRGFICNYRVTCGITRAYTSRPLALPLSSSVLHCVSNSVFLECCNQHKYLPNRSWTSHVGNTVAPCPVLVRVAESYGSIMKRRQPFSPNAVQPRSHISGAFPSGYRFGPRVPHIHYECRTRLSVGAPLKRCRSIRRLSNLNVSVSHAFDTNK